MTEPRIIAGASQLTVVEMRRHIGTLIKRHGIDCLRCRRPADAQAISKGWAIVIPEIKSDISYATALHEIGHLLGRHQTSHDLMVCERWAWRWAKQNALVWTRRMENDARHRLGGHALYSDWARPANMTEIRIIDDAIELNGVTVARLVPNLRLSQRDRLVELFDAAGEDEETIAELEDRVERLEEQLKARLKEPAR